MAESVVASAAQWIGSSLEREANTLFEVANQVQSLREDLEYLQQYLQDVDAKQDVREVCVMTGQIRKLAFQAEDVIDAYILKVQAKVREQGHHDWFVKFAWFMWNAPHIYGVGKQIQMVQSGIGKIIDKLNSYGIVRVTNLREGLRFSNDHGTHPRKKPITYPYDDDDAEHTVGLENNISKLVEILTSERNCRINFVSIVGMGGSGKTTLARKLYNHPYIIECFKCKAWVFISKEWSTIDVLSEILRKVGSTEETTELSARSSVGELVDKLRAILEKNSYFVVLDDVWSKEALQEILPALPWANSNKISKIIITTRNKEVMQFQNLQRHLYIHEPEPLSEDEGWELFCKITFDHCIDCIGENFEILGRKMLQKCDGLPLAIVALAGMLNTKQSISEWKQVSEVVRSRVMDDTSLHLYGRIGDMLALSYNDLPYYLKPCFLYLGVFPEDYLISTGMLTRLWIAEGLVTAQEGMSLDDVAMQRLEELSWRFMIQVVKVNLRRKIKAIRLHDLLRELCVSKARDQSFLEIYSPISQNHSCDATTVANQPRRIALHSSFSFPEHAPNLRSLIMLTQASISNPDYVCKESLELEAIRKNFELLRVLNLSGIQNSTGTLPAQIGNLIHLRYLGINNTNIIKLPKTIGNLRSLLTLDYRNIKSDNHVPIKIPNVLSKLAFLRHLILPIECPWDVKDLNLSNMKNLQILWGIKQEKRHNWLSREVPKLSTNLKKLKIVVSTEKELESVFRCPSIINGGLHTLCCSMTNGLTLRLVDPLYHCESLHKLTLIGKIEIEQSLTLPVNLVKLVLKDSELKNEDFIVGVGALIHLKLLRLSNAYVGTKFHCRHGSFPQLQQLYIDNFRNLEGWRIDRGAFPCLKKLEITNCRRLREFPQGFRFVTTLQQLEFFLVPHTFRKSAFKYGWRQQKLNKMPYNCEAIIEHCDFRIDVSSIFNLYELLTAGVFLDNRTKKYWVVKHGSCYYNCFMVFAVDLILDFDGMFDGKVDVHALHSSESVERVDTAIKLTRLIQGSSLSGSFNLAYITPEVTYKISFVIMLSEGQEMTVKCGLRFRHDIWSHNAKVKVKGIPGKEWTQVLVGQFETSLEESGDLEFSMFFMSQKPFDAGILIKGVIIEPNLPSF